LFKAIDVNQDGVIDSEDIHEWIVAPFNANFIEKDTRDLLDWLLDEIAQHYSDNKNEAENENSEKGISDPVILEKMVQESFDERFGKAMAEGKSQLKEGDVIVELKQSIAELFKGVVGMDK